MVLRRGCSCIKAITECMLDFLRSRTGWNRKNLVMRTVVSRTPSLPQETLAQLNSNRGTACLQPAEHLWPRTNTMLVNRHFASIDDLEGRLSGALCRPPSPSRPNPLDHPLPLVATAH